MDAHGEVAGGHVDPGAPRRRPGVRRSACGWTIDSRARRVRRRLDDRSVVLVEASDLARADRYRPYVVGHRATPPAASWRVRRADALFGELLDHVDPTRDVVIVVGPAHAQDGVTLTPLAIRGPGSTPGLLTSSTTRRSGFVQIQDVAPTDPDVARQSPVPTSMEGEPVETGETGGPRPTGSSSSATPTPPRSSVTTASARCTDCSLRRSRSTVALFFVALVRPRAGAGGARPGTRPSRRSGSCPRRSSPALVPFHDHGARRVLPVPRRRCARTRRRCTHALARRSRDRRRDRGAARASSALLTVDALARRPARAELRARVLADGRGTVRGLRQPGVRGVQRVGVAGRVPARAPRRWAARLRDRGARCSWLALVVDVAPMWGSDVGGILSMVPAYAVTLVVLRGPANPGPDRRGHRRCHRRGRCSRGRDRPVARPREDRTHLGRFLDPHPGPGDRRGLVGDPTQARRQPRVARHRDPRTLLPRRRGAVRRAVVPAARLAHRGVHPGIPSGGPRASASRARGARVRLQRLGHHRAGHHARSCSWRRGSGCSSPSRP